MRIFIFYIFIIASCVEPYAHAELRGLPRTLPRLLQWQGIDWYDVITYRTSSIAVLDAFFHTTGINRATLMHESSFSNHLLADHLRGRHIISHSKLQDLMAAMRQLLNTVALDKQSHTDLLTMIDALPAAVRVERVVAKLHRHQHRFVFDSSQLADIERVLAIKERDMLNIEHKFADNKHKHAAVSVPKFFQKTLAHHKITLDDMRNYNNYSASMLVVAMRGLQMSLAELSEGTGAHRQSLIEYQRGETTLRDRVMARVETFIRQRMGSKRQEELDAFFKKLNTAIKVERTALMLAASETELRPALAATVQRVIKIRRTSLQLTAYGVTLKDVRHYRRSCITIIKEIMETVGMSATALSISSKINKNTLPKFLKTNKLFREETLRKLEKYLHHQAKQHERLIPLRQELRRAFHVERAAQKILKDNIKPSPIQKELLDRVAKAP